MSGILNGKEYSWGGAGKEGIWWQGRYKVSMNVVRDALQRGAGLEGLWREGIEELGASFRAQAL